MSMFTVASKEFKDGLRNRWLISITAIFTILSIGLTYFGSAVSGTLEVASLSTTIASLASLTVFLVPLIALLVSYDSFVGEQESGTLLLLLTYPLSKPQLLLGKFIGQGAIIGLAIFFGFGSCALILYSQHSDIIILYSFAIFIASAILLGLSFTAIAYLISLSVNEKSKAAGLALITWFLFALVFDLALLAFLVGVEQGISQQGLTKLMMLNPADIFRLVNLAGLDSADVNGSVAMAVNSTMSQTSLFSVLTAWIILPLSLSIWLLKKKTL
ncbi:ABC transporter permease subunit [Thalassotalea sp. Y01]|uniref:ABC transporter permease n=1 Tax=Thalassotalea sp. Y01 TaxID=2729613 RepID=UPI00145C4C28|nr:ABC transporter permease subunit [Thalassotalea sp. Y01]NMP16445.1 ABC transporter permease subunit [Thalassotalea sp. Y01]